MNRSLDKWFNLPAERYRESAVAIQRLVLTREMRSLQDDGRAVGRRLVSWLVTEKAPGKTERTMLPESARMEPAR